MKTLYLLLAASLLFGSTISTARAATNISVDFFHDSLDAYGDWREVGEYGYCWQPRGVDSSWRPYSDGRWLYTDAGWTWDSDEPYSWAVYHYGRWAKVEQAGWVWVPGTEWGPAWVSWRRSPRHVGWAPLPPKASFSRTVGFNPRVDVDFDIGPANYTFVEVRNFGAPRLRTVILEPRDNIAIIYQTTNITRVTYVNQVVFNEGPRYDRISRETEQPIRRLKLERREDFDGDAHQVRAEQMRSRVEGDSFRVVTPQFDTRAATAPRKVGAKVEKAELDHGWKDAGPTEEVTKLRTKFKSESDTASELPPEPKTEKVAETSVESPVASPNADEKRAKEKARHDNLPPNPAAHEAASPPPEKPEIKGKGQAVQDPAPNQSNEGKNKSGESQQAPPAPKVHEEKPKTENTQPKEKQQPAAEAPPQKNPPAKDDSATVPDKLEPRPESKKPPEPQQQAPADPQQPDDEKGKKKHKKDNVN